jgi:hypothetical protein
MALSCHAVVGALIKLLSHQKVKMIKIHVATCILFIYLCYNYDRENKKRGA